MTIWRSILTWLAALSADPVAVPAERARCEAAVMAAYASYAPDDVRPPAPTPAKACPCKGACKGTGQWKPDGSIVARCEPGCKSCSMKSVLATECSCGGNCSKSCSCGCQCPDGKCPRKPGGK